MRADIFIPIELELEAETKAAAINSCVASATFPLRDDDDARGVAKSLLESISRDNWDN